MTDNRKVGTEALGASEASDTGPKFIISVCKNKSPFHFVVTLFHNHQLCREHIQLGLNSPAHPSSELGLADVCFVLTMHGTTDLICPLRLIGRYTSNRLFVLPKFGSSAA
jgi:hypothetical protein